MILCRACNVPVPAETESHSGDQEFTLFVQTSNSVLKIFYKTISVRVLISSRKIIFEGKNPKLPKCNCDEVAYLFSKP